MNSIDALARAIKEYEGGVVIVSHDFRTFPRLVAWIYHVQRPLSRFNLTSSQRTVGGKGS